MHLYSGISSNCTNLRLFSLIACSGIDGILLIPALGNQLRILDISGANLPLSPSNLRAFERLSITRPECSSSTCAADSDVSNSASITFLFNDPELFSSPLHRGLYTLQYQCDTACTEILHRCCFSKPQYPLHLQLHCIFQRTPKKSIKKLRPIIN